MAWTAEITNKAIANGLLKVDVSFTDGTNIVTDRFESRSIPTDWLKNAIVNRLAELETVYATIGTITIGAYVPEAVVEPPLTGRALYKKRLEIFDKMVSAIRKGLITDANADFIALRNWLRNNFIADYIDLI